jgi:hypothetical protein
MINNHLFFYRSLLLLFFVIPFSYSLSAQQVIRQEPCVDAMIKHQADSIKALVAKDGFTLVREASMMMESEYEMPVVVPLEGKAIYHFVFIGDITSRLYEVRMYDMDEKMVVYQKKLWGDVDGNIIAFSHVAQFSEMHMFKPVQVNKKKKKGMCGYVMLFRKTS